MMAVARAGIMEPFDNHTFQPNAVVQRADFAVVMSRLLTRLVPQNPVRGRSWTAARVKFADLPATHLAYPAASMAVTAGVMSTAGDMFQPARIVTGAEAIQAVSRIAALASASAAPGGSGSSGVR
jgi:hypothetical protein